MISNRGMELLEELYKHHRDFHDIDKIATAPGDLYEIMGLIQYGSVVIRLGVGLKPLKLIGISTAGIKLMENLLPEA